MYYFKAIVSEKDESITLSLDLKIFRTLGCNIFINIT